VLYHKNHRSLLTNKNHCFVAAAAASDPIHTSGFNLLIKEGLRTKIDEAYIYIYIYIKFILIR